jgi:hypothetical protein
LLLYKRVPRRFQHADRRTFARTALKTDSRAEAERKASAVEAELFAYWEALAAGRDEDVRRRCEAARQLGEARGFRYIPVEELAVGPLDDIIARLEAIAELHRWGDPARAVVDALTDAQRDFFELTVDRLKGKSEAQRHR